jgi:flavodoxin
MKTTLYYFTEWNSLSVARKISEKIEDAELISVVSQMKTDKAITAPSGRVGIICPVYDAGIPVIVRDFLHRLKNY